MHGKTRDGSDIAAPHDVPLIGACLSFLDFTAEAQSTQSIADKKASWIRDHCQVSVKTPEKRSSVGFSI
jgi:hypothetical protein